MPRQARLSSYIYCAAGEDDPPEELLDVDYSAFAELFPVPDKYRTDLGGGLAINGSSGENSVEDYWGEFDEDRPWLTPRIALQLYLSLLDAADIMDHIDLEDKLPPVAQPYCRRAAWSHAYKKAHFRLAARLAKARHARMAVLLGQCSRHEQHVQGQYWLGSAAGMSSTCKGSTGWAVQQA
jgi:hypothetical protein